MNRLLILGVLLAVGVGGALADSDAIATRRTLMKADGADLRVLLDMMQGKTTFDLAAAQKAFAGFEDIAAKSPTLFPPDSKTGDTNALPAIWDNKADFEARFTKFGADAKAAAAAVTDQASLKANLPGVLKNCGGCHELYKQKS
jgi:cytochrome c556